MIPVVAKYFEFSPKLFLRKNCKSIYSVYGILHKKFSDEEMKLLLDKACEMEDTEFFKSVVKENDVKENVFVKTPNPLLWKIGDNNIELLVWIVDNVEFKDVDSYIKWELFSSILHRWIDILDFDTLKHIIGKLDISIEDINYSDYVFYISTKNVEWAVELINLFGKPIKAGLYEHILEHAIQGENYDLAIYIIENHNLDYDIFREIQTKVFSTLKTRNTKDTNDIIKMILDNLRKERYEISRDCIRRNGINPFRQDDDLSSSDSEDLNSYW